ncbi:isochorismatase family protein [Shewanella sp. UCD-KL12]|uniref:isochorismatase family protein n=1 Tax=Shewanella sp. UCD-KL12 TaxID=1917163 RepID=UPI000970EBFF|nr:isochorismatase family protein [Shewanella sp. UCD-KL12]
MLKPQEAVLVVVDVQGKLAQVVNMSDELQLCITKLIKGLQLFELPMLWLEQLPEKLGHTSPAVHDELIKCTKPISKQHFSGWHCDEFRSQLIGAHKKEVILVGIEAHVCVYQTCIDLLDNGFNVHLVVDALSSRTVENKALGIAMMQAKGAQITNMESLLFELQHEAVGECFRQLIKIIK